MNVKYIQYCLHILQVISRVPDRPIVTDVYTIREVITQQQNHLESDKFVTQL